MNTKLQFKMKPALVAAVVLLPALFWVSWGLWGAKLFAKWGLGANEVGVPTLGQVGDLFGGINALFAAYAFAGVAVAAFFQYKTFRQVEDQQRMQAEQLAQQAFEPLFFRLLEMVDKARPLKLKYRQVWNDEELPDTAAGNLANHIQNQPWYGQLDNMSATQVRERLEKIYGEFYVQNELKLGPYFRTIYHIFKLIDRSAVPVVSRVQYANIARATISQGELFIHLLNCGTDRGRGLKTLIEEYGLLKHVRVTDGNHVGTHITDKVAAVLLEKIYQPTAYGDWAERRKIWNEKESRSEESPVDV